MTATEHQAHDPWSAAVAHAWKVQAQDQADDGETER